MSLLKNKNLPYYLVIFLIALGIYYYLVPYQNYLERNTDLQGQATQATFAADERELLGLKAEERIPLLIEQDRLQSISINEFLATVPTKREMGEFITKLSGVVKAHSLEISSLEETDIDLEQTPIDIDAITETVQQQEVVAIPQAELGLEGIEFDENIEDTPIDFGEDFSFEEENRILNDEEFLSALTDDNQTDLSKYSQQNIKDILGLPDARFIGIFRSFTHELSVLGDYENILKFINDLDDSGRFVEITKIDMATSDNTESYNPIIGSTITFKLFTYEER